MLHQTTITIEQLNFLTHRNDQDIFVHFAYFIIFFSIWWFCFFGFPLSLSLHRYISHGNLFLQRLKLIYMQKPIYWFSFRKGIFGHHTPSKGRGMYIAQCTVLVYYDDIDFRSRRDHHQSHIHRFSEWFNACACVCLHTDWSLCSKYNVYMVYQDWTTLEKFYPLWLILI